MSAPPDAERSRAWNRRRRAWWGDSSRRSPPASAAWPSGSWLPPLGMLAGALMARSYVVEHRDRDLLRRLRWPRPCSIYVPVLFALFGVTRTSQVAVVFTYAFFVDRGDDACRYSRSRRRLVEMALAFGASERQIFWTRRTSRGEAARADRSAPRHDARGQGHGGRRNDHRAQRPRRDAEGARRASSISQGVLAVLMVIVLVSVGCSTLVRALGRRLVGGRAA